MIRHIVLFRLKDARPDKVEAAAQMLRSMRGKIEGLLDLEVGLDFLASERSYHLALLCTFDNEEHFAAYAGRPVRIRLIRPLENGVRELTGLLLRTEETGELEVQLDEETSVTVEKKECSSILGLEDWEE